LRGYYSPTLIVLTSGTEMRSPSKVRVFDVMTALETEDGLNFRGCSMDNQICILHISDLHFGAEDTDKVEAVIRIAEQEQYKPNIACITGDTVNFPWKNYFHKARNFINRLKPLCENRIHIVPGNHDAYLRHFSLGMYERHLNCAREYCKHYEINGKDVCIFGIDSTCLTIGSLNNAGKFSKGSIKKFKNHIENLRSELGDDRFERSIKVVLLHHHPLPTVSSTNERMLYLKNAGILLNMATQENMNLILHGHQHDPAYYSLECNLSGEKKTMIVLSAGTATKRLDEKHEGISNNTQIHLIIIEAGKLLVLCLNYDYDSKAFYKSRYFEKAMPLPKTSILKEHYKFIAKSNGDMEVIQETHISAKTNSDGIDKIPVYLGVDIPGDEITGLDGLNFEVYRNGSKLDEQAYTLVQDEIRLKKVEVNLSPKIMTSMEKVSYRYTWPRGFFNLIHNGVDRGIYVTPYEKDYIKIEVEVESPNIIKDFKVIYYDLSKVTHLHKNESSRRGFEIHELTANNQVHFITWI
jgi:UDP-2,3-diacylglucosamine pyrophosphatase LpxH